MATSIRHSGAKAALIAALLLPSVTTAVAATAKSDASKAGKEEPADKKAAKDKPADKKADSEKAASEKAAKAQLGQPYYLLNPPPLSDIHKNISDLESLAHLRIAFNVAALACQPLEGKQIARNYNGFLKDWKPELDKAIAELRAKFQKQGKNWRRSMDRYAVHNYNHFSSPYAQEAFCKEAGEELQQAGKVPNADRLSWARESLARVDAPIADMERRFKIHGKSK